MVTATSSVAVISVTFTVHTRRTVHYVWDRSSRIVHAMMMLWKDTTTGKKAVLIIATASMVVAGTRREENIFLLRTVRWW